MAKAEQLNEEEFWGHKKMNMSRFLFQAAGLGPSHQLLAAVAAASILSSTAEHVKQWASQEEGSINAVAPKASISAMNRFCSMASGLISLTEATTTGVASQVVNTAPNEATKMLVMRQRAIWASLMNAHTVSVIEHPVLGAVVLAQPLLSSVIQARARISAYEGEKGGIDDLLSYMIIEAGADCNIPNSIGITPLMMAVASFIQEAAADSEDNESIHNCVKVVKELIKAGADVNQAAVSFGGRRGGGSNWGLNCGLYGASEIFVPFLNGEMGKAEEFKALDLLLSQQLKLGGAGRSVFEEIKTMLEESISSSANLRGDTLRGGKPRIKNVPWTHACYNILWSASQVAASSDVLVRRKILASIRQRAPFNLPALTVVSITQLKSLGKIPRFSTKEPNPSFEPIPVHEISPDGLVVFLSHRWLGNGCPDDDKGTKLSQVYDIAAKLGAVKGRRPEDVYFWIDYSVCDQSDPMPGVQMLPVYIACCDAFIWCDHPQYDQRAWCLTEQFMLWKLSRGSRGTMKFCLGTDGTFKERDVDEKPKDPSLGMLAFEGDRVALATMVSILPYN